MLKDFKRYLERIAFAESFARRRRQKRLERKYAVWKEKGAVLPMPPLGKQMVLEEYAARFSPPVFVETGTYKGDMVYAMLNKFEKMYSIELDEVLFAKAQRKFAGYEHVSIMCGQSGAVLPDVLKGISQACMFWLDAHYSGGCTAKGELDTPILQELRCILAHPNARDHIILIDDAREFTGGNDYPTVEGLSRFITDTCPGRTIEVKDDIIRVCPAKRIVR
ncbi:MAG: hypothetical protein KAR47_18590 [Planctomycetes bacterium]|nr:hypothetical protein [Planctomycetota bacterium]